MHLVRRYMPGSWFGRKAGAGPGSGEDPSSHLDATVVVVAPPPPPARPEGAQRDRAPFLVLLVAALAILWLARAVLAPFIVAAVVAYAFSPLVMVAQRRTGWPRIAIVAIGYVIAIAIIVVLVVLLAGRVASELQLLAASGPDSLTALLRQLFGGDSLDIAGQRITVAELASEIQARLNGFLASPGDAVHLVTQTGEWFLEAILTLIVTFYFLIDGERLWDRAIALLPDRHRGRTVEVVARIHETLGKWLRGQLFLIALVAAIVYVVLGPILHLPYALGIAILTGILEIIPLVGPLIATAIAATDAFAHGGAGLAGVVVVIYFVLRQVEDQVVMPVVIGRAVHLHPVVTIFAVLVGLSIYGVLGGLLGVPIAAALNVVFRELYPTPDTAPG
ncbi:MAG TPA: AI-2E family transporter [Candidatus Limnocylindrales bacterium]|nr:AI-2E family transporter [Candidatus Limnocylindrales bacterium]